MPLRVDFSILNQKGTPAFFSDIFANRPAAGFAGRVFISTDTGAIYEDTGSTWTLIADAGAGTTGTLQQVTTNGNTTTQGLVVSGGNVAIGTAIAGAALDVHTANNIGIQLNNTATGNSYIAFQNQDIGKWRIGNNYNGGANSFDIYNNSLFTSAISVNAGTNIATFNGGIVSTGSADQQLWVYGSSPSLRLYNSITSPSIVGFLGMATSTNNFIQGSANGDMAIGTSTGGKLLFGTASGTINPQLTLTSTNFVGINKINPSVALDVVGAGNFTSSLTSINLNAVSTNPYLILNDTSGTAAGAITFQNNGIQKWNLATQGTSNDLGFYNNGGTNSFNLYIQHSNGNVGIGTTSPARLLNISGGGTDGTQLQINGTVDSAGIKLMPTTGDNWEIQANTSNQFFIYNRTDSAYRFLIDGTGNVGIGTSAPVAPLSLYKAAGTPYMRIDDGTGFINFGIDTAGSNATFFNTNSSYKFLTNSGTTTALTITSGGVVLIGQTTLSAASAGTQCQISGDTLMTGSLAGVFFENRSGGVTSNSNWGGWYWVGTSTNLYNGASNVAAINMSTGVYTPLSNINKKKDFEQSTLGLNCILNLKPTLYRMIDDDENTNKHLGFIAQEVKEYLPQAYVENINDNDTFIGINQMPIIATLVKAIQELNEKLIKNNIN